MWPFVLALGFGTLVAIALLGGRRRVLRTVECPVTGRRVVLQVQEAVWDGRPVDVEACSAFTPPSAIICDKACLRRPPTWRGPGTAGRR